LTTTYRAALSIRSGGAIEDASMNLPTVPQSPSDAFRGILAWFSWVFAELNQNSFVSTVFAAGVILTVAVAAAVIITGVNARRKREQLAR
jgi:hypothetical protein